MEKQINKQLNNRRELLEQRRNLRSNATPAERMMWKLLKGKQIMGLQWRRQFSVGSYILDFYCPQLHLCIELDGEPHFTVEGKEKDNIRSQWLLEHGIHVIRFENRLIFEHPQSIIAEIEAIAKQLTLPNSLPRLPPPFGVLPLKPEGEP